MNSDHLQYVLEIEKCGSISKAAKKLHVSQPHLSKVLQELEAAYNLTIFQRTEKGIHVTPQGKQFLIHAAKIIHELEQLQTQTQQKEIVRQNLHIASETVSHCMEAFLAVLHKHLTEESNLLYYEMPVHEVIDAVARRECEMGILCVGSDTTTLVKLLLTQNRLSYRVLNRTSLCVVMRKDHPLANQKEPIHPEQIYQYGLILARILHGILSDWATTGFLSDVFDGQKLKKVIHVNTRAALHNLLTRTDYLAFGTDDFRGQTEFYGLVSRPLDDPKMKNYFSEMWAIWPNHEELSPLAQEFISEVKNCYNFKFMSKA